MGRIATRARHITVRMAWHDNGWNGHVCSNPMENTYCTGVHSLLSGRIEKRKNIELEQKHSDKAVGEAFKPANVPPCYWSINAFSENGFDVEHHHAFGSITETIWDHVKPYSFFTWPFKLSFVHSDENKKLFGNYPPDLEKRIEDYRGKFRPGKSVVFFYANYDNPVSADEMKYLVLGASIISNVPEARHFPLSNDEVKKWRAKDKMQNFPTVNWALQFSHDPDKHVLLPYKEYLAHIDRFPDASNLLDEMKVVVDEESLISGFKYVSMDVDDDKCLYLLYKRRKAYLKIESHAGQVVSSDVSEELKRIEDMIRLSWEERSIYPSLHYILDFILQDNKASENLAQLLIDRTDPKSSLFQLLNQLDIDDLEDDLEEYEDELDNFLDNPIVKRNLRGLCVLALHQLSKHQINKILDNSGLLADLAENPYILYEEYSPDERDPEKLDDPEFLDERIDVYKVDLACVPDRTYVKRHRDLQNLKEHSAERIRSVIVDHLWRIGEQGHCYEYASDLMTVVREYPLIYKQKGLIVPDDLLSDLSEDYRSHFLGRLFLLKGESKNYEYYYLREIRHAEEFLEKLVKGLAGRSGYVVDKSRISAHISSSLSELSGLITTEDDVRTFEEERTQLYENVLNKSLYFLTGRPGSGKTFETSHVIKELLDQGEDVVVLAPTGKASLRLNENLKKVLGQRAIQAMTIDRFIANHRFSKYSHRLDQIGEVKAEDKVVVPNLVIDECSMIDLPKLYLLLSIIRIDRREGKAEDLYLKRLIMVGDENQLPPIGFGKPFHDMIEWALSDEKRMKSHYINLVSNCRQQNDTTILRLAEAFANKTRYYEEALEILKEERKDSEGLFLRKWRDADALKNQILESTEKVAELELGTEYLDNPQSDFNLLLGLYDNGHVPNRKDDSGHYQWKNNLRIENIQVLSPYRPGFQGTIGLNKFIQNTFRDKTKKSSPDHIFYHGDKIIRLYNWYTGRGQNRKLKLANGSLGLVTGEWGKRRYWFPEMDYPQKWVDDEENFDLAYAISVHKSQGSDFQNVLLVIPKKKALLSRELIYTALTRSRSRLFVFHEEVASRSVLEEARGISHVQNRRTSLFELPSKWNKSLFPVPGGDPVRSRIEYIISTTLQKYRVKFSYEQELDISHRSFNIHPDFTIELEDGRLIYWEHLGMLDVRKYYRDWQERKQDYIKAGLIDQLVTTDDLEGISQEKIDLLVEKLIGNKLESSDSKFSNYHYQLY